MTVEKKEWIIIKGAREHNLKDVTVRIPKNSLVVITGKSGSGKSSIALDVLYAEGKRKYTESLSAYARQFLGTIGKPDVDSIEGLCPAIAIEQKTVGSNPRSTVGTITEVYDCLRVLYARIGIAHCPHCKKQVKAQSSEELAAVVSIRFSYNTIAIYAPIAHQEKGEFVHELTKLFTDGYYRVRIDGVMHKFSHVDQIKALKLQKTYKHTIDVLLDIIEISHEERHRVQTALERAFVLAKGLCKIVVNNEEHLYSSSHACVECGEPIPEFEPRHFSFNSPIGACTDCQGLGVIQAWNKGNTHVEELMFKGDNYFPVYQEKECTTCSGQRLNKYARSVMVQGLSLPEMVAFSVEQLQQFFQTTSFDPASYEIIGALVKEVDARLTFLHNVGLSYLTLNRPAQTLSGGEGQRIRLATQIGSMLTGVMYVLDEPSIGLHQRDNDMLILTLQKLRDIGNTVIVVEHDLDTIRRSDYVVEMGPAAGVHGGKVVAVGTPQEIAENEQSLTGAYLSGKRAIKREHPLRSPRGFMTLRDASKNNLKNITVQIPLGVLCGISGVSGSGKSTLIMQELVPALERQLNLRSFERAGSRVAKKGIKIQEDDDQNLIGARSIESLIVIDQSPIGRTPRSNPATYLGIFDDIRRMYAALPESQARGYKMGTFSFNTADGRCFECSGEGVVTYEMHFLPEVVVVCKRCKGKRYNEGALEIICRGKNIAEVLTMTAYEALTFFEHHKNIKRRLQLLCEVGLDYIQLGQASTTLSGGEAQRIKLVDELVKRGHNTLYILDEPTTGLHNSDIDRLLEVLNSLVNKGNSIIIIEHNIDVLNTVDYLIDLGPEGGIQGGYVVAEGPPEKVAHMNKGYTATYLYKSAV